MVEKFLLKVNWKTCLPAKQDELSLYLHYPKKKIKPDNITRLFFEEELV